MRARLGPQAPGKERPPTAATWETYPNPPVAPTTWGNPPHQAVRQIGGNSSNTMLHKKLDQYNNDYSGTSPRASHTPCLLGLIPKGRTNPVSLGTKTQGQDQPHTPTSECLPRGL
ncbi:hypothetical protein CK203_056645 [Vitis vinifera]|uniref:Uncharacterized protein n=1 Tax=Vitis vinifera TaxID=29760 RepID=A0A438CW47_VITVI|nr:hypothetical protein CK203_095414 [Vitis vinifera]RVW73837.1 hypothetical protein CK203_056645 [Vitis vinifera]